MKLDQYSLLKEKLNSDKYSLIFILVDDNTDKFCLDIFKEKSGVKRFNKIIIKSGEENKNIESCLLIWDKLNEFNADRKSLLINLGWRCSNRHRWFLCIYISKRNKFY
jgi:3-dehydroquinate synthase